MGSTALVTIDEAMAIPTMASAITSDTYRRNIILEAPAGMGHMHKILVIEATSRVRHKLSLAVRAMDNAPPQERLACRRSREWTTSVSVRCLLSGIYVQLRLLLLSYVVVDSSLIIGVDLCRRSRIA